MAYLEVLNFMIWFTFVAILAITAVFIIGAFMVFNEAREQLEEMHQSKIKVLRMYKPFIGGWRVVYVLENEEIRQ